MFIAMTVIICSFIYCLLVAIMYFSKSKIKNIDNRLYTSILISVFFGLVLEFMCCYMTWKNPLLLNEFAGVLINKLWLIYILVWEFLFTRYVVYISFQSQIDNDSKIFNIANKISYIALFIFVFLIAILRIDFFNGIENGVLVGYSYGPAVYCLSITAIICLIIDLISVFKNIKKIKSKKYIPLFGFIFCMILVVVIRMLNPQLLLINGAFCFVTVLMYFTIENPDVKMIEQLEFAKDAADKANAAKTDFLSSMSHEIRTPLNAIVGFSDCIKHADNLDEAKENADDIIDASNTLLEIVNGILDISKIEAGKLEIINSDYNARDLFSGLAKLVTPKMTEKSLDFQVTIAEDLPPTLYGDPANIKKVVTNLLSNAYKYTDKGYVKYDVKCVNNEGVCRLIISVEDSGRGIKKENVEKLFTKFQRVDEDKNTTIEGTGLGLAITKQLIELMGGTVVVTTEYGEGSKFIITLDQRIDNVIVNNSHSESSGMLDLTDKKLLIVDDNPLNLKVATKLFERYNAIIDTCDSGFKCLTKITNGEAYDLILMDDMMPKMSGTETLHKLKESSSFNIPVIALTANAITGMKDKYLNEGFNDYLAKPIDKDEMISVLGRIFSDNLEGVPTSISTVEEINNNTDFLEANGIDVKAGLELLGDISMYNETMGMFLDEMDNRLAMLYEYKENKDMSNYSILVHAIKSDCKYLGITELADVSYEHELKSKDKDIEYINSNFDNYISLVEDYVTICKSYLDRE